tara:strand:- start:1310 stop:1522 length:213 start_codon:yes stop_codon:yes gene_type:complete
MSDYYAGKTQCIGNLKTACSFIVNSKYMEEEFLDNYDDDGNKFPTWEAVVKYLVEECESGEVYELSTVRE